VKNALEVSMDCWLKVSSVPLASGDVSLNVVGGVMTLAGWETVPPHAVKPAIANIAMASATRCRFIAAWPLDSQNGPAALQLRFGRTS
jgi:hypothetical protein